MSRPLRWVLPALALLSLGGWLVSRRGIAEGLVTPAAQKPSANAPGAVQLPPEALPLLVPDPGPAAPTASGTLEYKLSALAPEGFDPGRFSRLMEILKRHPDDPEILAGVLGVLAASLDETEVAEFWKRALAAFPGNPVVLNMRLRSHLNVFYTGEGEGLDDLDPSLPQMLYLRCAVLARGGDAGELLPLLERAGSSPWTDDSGRAEHGRVRVLDELGESPDVDDRVELLLKPVQPQWLPYAPLLEVDRAPQPEPGSEEWYLRFLEGVERVTGRMEDAARTVGVYAFAQHCRENALCVMMDRAKEASDPRRMDLALRGLQALEARRKAFWNWSHGYRARFGEPLKPFFKRLGVAYDPPSLSNALSDLCVREDELSEDERRLLVQGIEALYGEMDAYRAASRP